MNKLSVKYKKQYTTILIEDAITLNLSPYLPKNRTYYVIADRKVKELYPDILRNIGYIEKIVTIEANEATKSTNTYEAIINDMLAIGFPKDGIVLALGGGITTDIAGFVAATYKRGISYISIPTTLVGQVDAAIGGKCGLNINQYKNQLGCIYHPELIVVDPLLLRTLPTSEYQNGMAEVIKYGFTLSKKLWDSLKKKDNINNIIFECIKLKTMITKKDEDDLSLRHVLNYGHTIGHLLESTSNFTLSHGEAVAIGMLVETTDSKLYQDLKAMFDLYNIKYEYSFNKIDIMKYLKNDKKVTTFGITLPHVYQVGKTELINMTCQDLERMIK